MISSALSMIFFKHKTPRIMCIELATWLIFKANHKSCALQLHEQWRKQALLRCWYSTTAGLFPPPFSFWHLQQLHATPREYMKPVYFLGKWSFTNPWNMASQRDWGTTATSENISLSSGSHSSTSELLSCLWKHVKHSQLLWFSVVFPIFLSLPESENC